jgi:hypothetical protein
LRKLLGAFDLHRIMRFGLAQVVKRAAGLSDDPSRLLFAARAPAVFCDQLANRINFHRELCDHAVLARALGLELLEPRQIARFQSAVLISPQPDRLGVAVTAARLLRGRAGVELLEDPDDLGFGEATFL